MRQSVICRNGDDARFKFKRGEIQSSAGKYMARFVLEDEISYADITAETRVFRVASVYVCRRNVAERFIAIDT